MAGMLVAPGQLLQLYKVPLDGLLGNSSVVKGANEYAQIVAMLQASPAPLACAPSTRAPLAPHRAALSPTRGVDTWRGVAWTRVAGLGAVDAVLRWHLLVHPAHRQEEGHEVSHARL